MNYLLSFMVLLVGTFLATASTAQQAPFNIYKTGQKDIQALSIFEGPLSVDEVAQQKFSTIADQRFVREPAQLELWFRFELRNESETSQLLLKNLDIVHMESRFYQWKDGKIREMTANDSWGSKVVPLDLAPGESIEIIGMQRSHIYHDLRFSVHTMDSLDEELSLDFSISMFLFFGLCLLILYNLYLYILTRLKVYRYYLFFVVVNLFINFAASGFPIPVNDVFGINLFEYIIIWRPFSAITLSFLIIELFALKSPQKFYLFNRLMIGICFIISFIGVFIGLEMAVTFNQILSQLFLLYILASIGFGIVRLRKKDPIAGVFLAAQGSFLISIFAYLAAIAGMAAFSPITKHIPSMGLTIEMTFMSLALAQHVRRLKSAEAKLVKLHHEKVFLLERTSIVTKRIQPLASNLKSQIAVLKDSGETPLFLDKVIRAGNLINDLIDSGLQSQDLNREILADKKPVSMIELSETLEKVFAQSLERKGLKLQVEGLQTRDIVLVTNPTILTISIVSNILNNAIKFSPEGGTIRLKFLRSATNIEISILDQGPGISQQVLDHLEDPDYLVSTKGSHGEEGTGFGLTIINYFTNMLGGTLEIRTQEKWDSQQNSFTEMTLRFPAAH